MLKKNLLKEGHPFPLPWIMWAVFWAVLWFAVIMMNLEGLYDFLCQRYLTWRYKNYIP